MRTTRPGFGVDLLVQSLQQGRALQVPVVLARQQIKLNVSPIASLAQSSLGTRGCYRGVSPNQALNWRPLLNVVASGTVAVSGRPNAVAVHRVRSGPIAPATFPSRSGQRLRANR